MRYLFLFLFLHILISHFLFFRSPLFFSFASSLDILCNSFFVLSLSYIFISLCHFSSLPPDIFFFFYFGYLPLLFFFHFQSIPYFIFSFFASYFIIKAFLIPKFSFIHIFFFHSFVHWFPFFSRLIFSTCLLFFFIFLIFFSLHSLFFYFLLPAFFVYFLLLFILSSLLPTSFLSLAFMYSAVSAYLTSLSFSLFFSIFPHASILLSFYFSTIFPSECWILILPLCVIRGCFWTNEKLSSRLCMYSGTSETSWIEECLATDECVCVCVWMDCHLRHMLHDAADKTKPPAAAMGYWYQALIDLCSFVDLKQCVLHMCAQLLPACLF